MPDFVGFSITALSSANVNVPRFTISGRVVDSETQRTVLADFTGVNAITFPNVLGQLSAADRRELVELIVHWLVKKRTGV